MVRAVCVVLFQTSVPPSDLATNKHKQPTPQGVNNSNLFSVASNWRFSGSREKFYSSLICQYCLHPNIFIYNYYLFRYVVRLVLIKQRYNKRAKYIKLALIFCSECRTSYPKIQQIVLLSHNDCFLFFSGTKHRTLYLANGAPSMRSLSLD